MKDKIVLDKTRNVHERLSNYNNLDEFILNIEILKLTGHNLVRCKDEETITYMSYI